MRNRYLHIEWEKTAHSGEKQHIKQHIEEKNNLSSLLNNASISAKTKNNIEKLYEAFGNEKIFGRSDVVKVLSITERPASTLLKRMHDLSLTEQITGVGKGKYKFNFRKEST